MAGVLTVAALVVLHRVTAVPTGTVGSRSTAPVSTPPLRLASTEASLPAAHTQPVSTPPIASVRLGTLPALLPAGTVDLVGQATAVLSADAVASGRAQAGNTEVVLSKGSIELRVLPRASGHQFAVNAGPYRFTVVGTAFTVSQTRSRIELVVSEGTVAVSRGTKRLATVAAGAEWAIDRDRNPLGRQRRLAVHGRRFPPPRDRRGALRSGQAATGELIHLCSHPPSPQLYGPPNCWACYPTCPSPINLWWRTDLEVCAP